MRARLLPLLAAALAAPTWAAELNVISSVEIKDTGPEVVLTVKGTRKPSFTTFSMADPPRFVIDFSESRFQGVPEETPGVGVVKLAKSLSYGTDASAIARVMLVFTADIDPPAVEEAGGALLVRVAKPGGGAAVAVADTKAPADADAKASADAKAKADADAKAKAEAKAQAQQEEERRQAQARADADAKAKADADARAKADAEVKAKLDEERRQAQAKTDSDAKAKADAKAQAQQDEERRQAQAKADADAKAQASAQAQAQQEDERRQAQASAEAKAASPAEDADQKALEAEIAAARAEKHGDKAKAQSVETLSPSEPQARVREVGFQQLAEASRVFVRTSSPVQFTIQEVDERTVRIQVENTRATRYNDLRFLDTSFFASAIQLITPSREGSSYVLTVKLRQRVPYQQVKQGDLLAVDFQRPPATASATPPPGDAPDTGAPGGSPEE